LLAEAIEANRGYVAKYYKLMPEKGKNRTSFTVAEQKQLAHKGILAILLIRRTDKTRYSIISTHLTNQHALTQDDYQFELMEAQAILVNYQTPSNTAYVARHVTTRTTPEAIEVTFAPKGPVVPREQQQHAYKHHISSLPESRSLN
jgi:hypothetical protein